MKLTVVKEIGRNKIYGFTHIKWHCRSCGHIMNLPQQQNFNYCFHCGREVVAKIGGKEEEHESN